MGDTDEFDDAPNGGAFKGSLITRLIDLTGIAPGSMKLEVFGSRSTGSTRMGSCRPSSRRWMSRPPAEIRGNTPAAVPSVSPRHVVDGCRRVKYGF
ncbi:MAG: hypothetical protein FJ286_12110 [Planctomycetes bacterium]|nr:hypothetical protein [Planctomycetota bacterium]